ncbi:hypothetical protein Ccrd_003989, partial [Cynara cardunculus var. scolymus]
MTTYLWRKYADYLHTKWEKEVLWTMVDPFKRPKSFTPLVTIYEKYWEDHPGEAVPIMRPKFYGGPWKIYKGGVLPPNKIEAFRYATDFLHIQRFFASASPPTDSAKQSS